MSKDAYYFSHDSNARNDEKILAVRMRHGAEGYGVYFMILERLRESEDYSSVKDYNVIAFDLRVDSQIVKSVVEDFGLFEIDEKRFYSASMRRRMRMKDSKSEQARKAAEKRWKKDKKQPKKPKNADNADALRTHSVSNASKGKESKGNNRERDSARAREGPESRQWFDNNSKVDKPQSLDAVISYCNSAGINPDIGRRFYGYYEESGWCFPRGSNMIPVANWKQKLQNDVNKGFHTKKRDNGTNKQGNRDGASKTRGDRQIEQLKTF